jgi:hypothetical protein
MAKEKKSICGNHITTNSTKRRKIMKKLITVGLFALTLGSTGSAMASVHSDSVDADSTDVYRRTFRGDQETEVSVQGDGDTVLRLRVYDENGRPIGSDTCRYGTCDVTWEPRWTGRFRIEVENQGSVWNAYNLTINEHYADDEY